MWTAQGLFSLLQSLLKFLAVFLYYMAHLLRCMYQGNIENSQDSTSDSVLQDPPAARDLFLSNEIKNFNRDDIEKLAESTTQRAISWIVVLYAPWCPYCQVSMPTFFLINCHATCDLLDMGSGRDNCACVN
jgi:thiol-disulfide isomerase/thioredoxin